jgi:hypothetical protein
MFCISKIKKNKNEGKEEKELIFMLFLNLELLFLIQKDFIQFNLFVYYFF